MARSPQGRHRVSLSRDRILRAATALADEAGIEALTMRSLGEQLGTEAMSLYRHVRNKDDLLDGLVDLVYGEIDLPVRTPSWKSAMRRRAIAVRQAMSRHPWAIALMESRTQPGPENLRHHDWVLRVLRGAGFTSATATHAYNLLDSYIYGFALQERSLPFSSAEELAEVGPALIQQIPGDLYPALKAVATDLIASGFDYGAEFEFGLDLILDALERTRR
jgi:AcrR family transcriptional regulator